MAQFNNLLGITEREHELERVLDGIYVTAKMETNTLAGDLTDEQIKILHKISYDLKVACEQVLEERGNINETTY